MAQDYGSHQLKVHRPPRVIGLIQIAGSLIVLAFILVSVIFSYKTIDGSD